MRHRFHRFALLSTLLFTLLLALWGLKQNVNAAPAPLRGGAVPGAANPQSSSLYLPMVLRDFEPGRIPEKLGLVFVNSAEDHRTATRIQRGVVAGADLDRFPLYWHEVETSAGVFDWSDMDQALQDNLAQGLHTMPIFLGTPPFYFPTPFTPDNTVPLPPIGGGPLRDAALPDAPQRPMDNGCTVAGTPPAQNIFQPIFSDGTDIPGPGKTINPNNYWARFIFKAVLAGAGSVGRARALAHRR